MFASLYVLSRCYATDIPTKCLLHLKNSINCITIWKERVSDFVYMYICMYVG